MTISERYKIASINKKKKNNKLFFFIIMLLLFVSFTYSRYTATSDVETKVEIAKWNMKINGVQMNQNVTSINNIDLIYDGKENGNAILPNQTGYFDIEIDPSETEVSIEYKIKINMENMPDDMKITGYTLNTEQNNQVQEFSGNNEIQGSIQLQDNQKLDNSDIMTYRVYWKWLGNTAIIDNTSYFINANVIVKQVL